VVEGVEGRTSVDFELKGLVGTGVENRDRDMGLRLAPKERDLDSVAAAVGEFAAVAKACCGHLGSSSSATDWTV
jgi:hypothetical protein